MKEKGGRGGRSYTKYTEPISEGGSPYGSSKNLGGDSKTDCANIRFSTKLQNVEPGLSKVNKGDSLAIDVVPVDILMAYNLDGDPCGRIISPHNKKLIECIRKGKVFKAIAKNNTGDVSVEME